MTAHGPLPPVGVPSYQQERRIRRACAADGRGEAATAKNLPLVCRLPDRADPAALEAALRAFVERHSALRYRFTHRNNVVSAKRVDDECRVLSSVIHRDDLPDHPDAVRRHVRQVVDRPFDVLGWPLIRAALVQSDEPVFCLSMDHLVTDGWSLSVAMAELPELYRAALTGDRADLPPAGDHWAFCARQRQHFAAGPATEGQLAAFRRALGGRPVHPPFPVNVRPWDLSTGRYQTLHLLDPPEADSFIQRCRSDRATVFMGLLAAFGIASREVSGRNEVGLLIATHNRDSPGSQHSVGWYANMLPLYFLATGLDRFTETLRNVQRTLMGMLDHHELPIARVVGAGPDDPIAGDEQPTAFLSFTDDRTPGTGDRAPGWHRDFMAPAYRAGYGLWISLNDHGLAAETASPDSPSARHRLVELETAMRHVVRTVARQDVRTASRN